MTDTAALKPKWQLILGLLPSLNQCLVIAVTAAATCFSTLWLATPVAKPAATVTVERIIERPAPVDLAPLSALDKSIKELTAKLGENSGPGVNRRKQTAPLK